MSNVFHLLYSFDSLFDHAVNFIGKYGHGDVHIDIGCGRGIFAESLIERTGVKYIGIDEDKNAISELNNRGIEAYCHSFGNINQDVNFLKNILSNRSLASISALDVLEYVFSPDAFLQMLRSFAGEYSAPLILSVPNSTHKDVAEKILCGRIDFIPSGIMGENQKTIFSEKYLKIMVERNGWYQIDESDIISINSDQHFPKDLLVLTDASQISGFLSNIKAMADPTATIERFLRVYLSGPLKVNKEQDLYTPFMTVLIRTQGLRLETFRETLLCLTGQTCTDFEILVVGHKLTLDRQSQVEQIIEDTPNWIHEKIRLIQLYDGERAKPLNIGFANARGRYIAVFDDDDLVLSNWVEAFKNTAEKNWGKIVRSFCLKQDWITVKTQFSNSTVAAIGPLEKMYTRPFDYSRHLYENESPFMSLAFPKSVFEDMGYRFDETLTTTEDWDYLLRTSQLCGVADTDVIPCIYRYWKNSDSSKTYHDEAEWLDNQNAILRKLNKQFLLMPPGSIKSIRGLIEQTMIKPDVNEERLLQKRRFLFMLLTSKSWNITQIPRFISGLIFRRKKLILPDIFTTTEFQLDTLIMGILNSRSWRLTAWLRKK